MQLSNATHERRAAWPRMILATFVHNNGRILLILYHTRVEESEVLAYWAILV